MQAGSLQRGPLPSLEYILIRWEPYEPSSVLAALVQAMQTNGIWKLRFKELSLRTAVRLRLKTAHRPMTWQLNISTISERTGDGEMDRPHNVTTASGIPLLERNPAEK